MNTSDIARIVQAARLKGAPQHRGDTDGHLVHILHLAGPRDDLYAFTLREGHRRWLLETVTDQHGVTPICRTLGKRLSARLHILHGQARENFGDSTANQR